MSRILRAAVAVLALLAIPQFAHAGPIEWSMRGDIDYSRLGTEFYLGLFSRWTDQGQTTEAIHAYGLMPEGLLPVGAGSTDRIGLAVQSKQGYRFDANPPDTAVPSASAAVFNVWLTDVASGETGHLSMSLGAYLITGLPQYEYSELAYAGGGGGTLFLGGNRYDVRLGTGESDSAAWVYADLTVAPGIATPEPGTLVLASLGLGGVGMVRRLRRA